MGGKLKILEICKINYWKKAKIIFNEKKLVLIQLCLKKIEILKKEKFLFSNFFFLSFWENFGIKPRNLWFEKKKILGSKIKKVYLAKLSIISIIFLDFSFFFLCENNCEDLKMWINFCQFFLIVEFLSFDLKIWTFPKIL